MLHRRLLEDDSRGVGEPLNEKGFDGEGLTTYTTHYLLFSEEGSFSFKKFCSLIFSRCYTKYPEKDSIQIGLTIYDILFAIIPTEFQQNVSDNLSEHNCARTSEIIHQSQDL